MERILTGKIAVVTGGSAGIGYAVAKQFAAGAKVILVSRDPLRLATAAKRSGDKTIAIPTDSL
jgi:short-subunit dehydrogenase